MNTKTMNINPKGRVVRIPPKFDNVAIDMANAFGYTKFSHAIINSMKVGFKIFEDDKQNFLDILSKN
jgi:hypothetical protein